MKCSCKHVPAGHVIFEMSAGQEPSEYIPTEKDYELVKDDHLKSVVEYIFTKDTHDSTKFKHPLKEVKMKVHMQTTVIGYSYS